MKSNSEDKVQSETCQNIYEQDIFTQVPERVLRPGGLKLTRRMAEYCCFDTSAKVVDICCGEGVTAEFLQDNFGVVAVGIDVSKKLLEIGKARFPRLQLVEAAAERLPFANESMDGAVIECSLSVVDNAARVLAEIGRVLVAGAKLAITDIYFPDTASFEATKAGNAAKTAGVMTQAEITQLLCENGFDVRLWEDHSAVLKEFIAWFIMEHGSVELLMKCFFDGHKISHKSANAFSKLGYYLLIAEKR